MSVMNPLPHRVLRVQSERLIAPGEIWEALIAPRGMAAGIDMAFDRTPDMAAWFELERAEPMTTAHVHRYTNGLIERPGLYVRWRNRSSEARYFVGQVTLTPNLEALQRDVERHAERAWAEGGEPETVSQMRAIFEVAAPSSFEDDLAFFRGQQKTAGKPPTN